MKLKEDNMKQLHEATVQWAEDRYLIPNSPVTTQALKLGSEIGELCKNLALNDPIKDDIGDSLVVCAILAKLQENDLLYILDTVQPVIHNTPAVPTLIWYLGSLQDKAIKGLDFSRELRNIVHQLKGIALARHTTLEECWAIAYDDIKDRLGFTNEKGVFIKSTDPEYARLYQEFLGYDFKEENNE